jgi:hypothetical protein
VDETKEEEKERVNPCCETVATEIEDRNKRDK